ncbi:hypothetical protein HPP92_028582 [Vanilla planifolia]|uniref:FAM50A/XAP5 C-terminal domain-containing protein n=1 Tax=Vanilla planifolia TaxID=51239 RepID=A0A835P6U4_VANPL|nr:hypothetical protein HPP92_028582 [Vanilla planifolia]
MSGMGDGGKPRRKIQELKNKSASSGGQIGLLQFGSGTSEILETAFKKETVGLVTREQYVEKRVNIRNKIEEEEKEKLQRLQQEEEELQMQKRKKRRVKGDARLSFHDDIDNESDDDIDNNLKKAGHGKLGKDPTVETSFLPDRFAKVTQLGNFLSCSTATCPEFREIRTTSVENLLYVKEDLIIPHQHSFYELIVNKARGKSGPLFHFDVHEDVRTVADATIEKDESHAGKVVERHWYEKNKHIFPASRWEIYDPTKKWERYTIHGD